MDPIRQHLARALAWGDAHVDFDAAVEGLAPALRGVRPEGAPHSAWELLEHMRFTQRDILDFCVDADYQEPAWPDAYWPDGPAPPPPDAWDRVAAAFREDRRRLQALVEDPTNDLLAPLPHGSGQTLLREALLAADHASYHLGQLVLVRRLLDAW